MQGFEMPAAARWFPVERDLPACWEPSVQKQEDSFPRNDPIPKSLKSPNSMYEVFLHMLNNSNNNCTSQYKVRMITTASEFSVNE